MKNKLSAAVLTKNSQSEIADCLKSLSFCDEIVVIDDMSSDATVSVIKKTARPKGFGPVRIFRRPLKSDFAAQRNFALNKVRGDWVLFVDADEGVSAELQAEIVEKAATHNQDKEGYYLRRLDSFYGRWLLYGETGNIRFVRLAKKRSGRWQGRVHEKWQVKGAVGNLKQPLYHYPHKNLSSFLGKINSYSDIVAQYWVEQGRRSSLFQIVFFPAGKFIFNYFLKFGFLDGVPGLVMAVMMSFHSFLVRGKVYLHQKYDEKTD